jgi:hypothetical protein
LKGVTKVTYHSVREPVLDEDGSCKVDMSAMVTSIAFVANQSTRLKFVTDDEHSDEIKVLEPAPQHVSTDDKTAVAKFREAYSQWRRRLAARIHIPGLTIEVTSAPTPGGCVAQVKGELFGTLEDSKIISTGKEMANPQVRLWSRSIWVKAPFSTFSDSVIRVGEEVMKGFVNDWAASQTLPD